MFFCNPTTDAFDQHIARECTALMSAGDTGFSETRWQGMASGRALVLLDEPTGGLDSPSIGCLWGELTRAAGSAERAIVIARSERLDRVPLVGSIELPLG